MNKKMVFLTLIVLIVLVASTIFATSMVEF